MKRYISSADYVNYNANSRGNNVGDCVKRALSMAFDMDYNQTSKELNELVGQVELFQETTHLLSMRRSIA